MTNDHLNFKCDLDLQTAWTNVSNGTSTYQGEVLCQIILKSMNKSRSCDPDKSRWMHTHTPNWNCNNYVKHQIHKLNEISPHGALVVQWILHWPASGLNPTLVAEFISNVKWVLLHTASHYDFSPLIWLDMTKIRAIEQQVIHPSLNSCFFQEQHTAAFRLTWALTCLMQWIQLNHFSTCTGLQSLMLFI